MEYQDIIDENQASEQEVFAVIAQQDSVSGKSLLFSYTSYDKKNAINVAKLLAEENNLIKVSNNYWTNKKGNSISIFKLEINKKPITKDLFPF